MNLLEKENINLSSSVREYVKKDDGVEFKMSNHFDQGHRKVLAEAIRKQYAGLELHHEVKNNIDNLEKTNSVTIVTGHQLCLAGGPLFLFYKICSTIALSKKWSDSLKGYNVVPVFWLASEDHDLNEIRRFWFKENWVELGPEVSGIAGDFPTDFFSQWLNTEIERHSEFTSLLQIAYSKFETNAESFRFWINEIFGENGVVCIDGNEESLKQLALPLFQKELEEQFVNAGVEIQNEKLRTENQTPAIQPRKLNLFHINQGQRFRLEIEGENIVEVNSKEVLSKAELLAEVKGLSPNVLLRPVYQEFLLPNLAYVGGSGELEYWIQLPEVFSRVKLNFPKLIRRVSATLIKRKDYSFLEKFSLCPSEMQGTNSTVRDKVLNLLGRVNFSSEKEKSYEMFENVLTQAKGIDSSIESWIHAERKKQLEQWDAIQNKLNKAIQRKEEDVFSKLTSIQKFVMPAGKSQERVLTLLEASFYFNLNDLKETLINQDPENLEHLFLS